MILISMSQLFLDKVKPEKSKGTISKGEDETVRSEFETGDGDEIDDAQIESALN